MATVDTTKLTAVNDVLAGARKAAVSALDATRDATIAERVLDRTNETIQSEVWLFNREFDVTLTPDGGNEIPIDTDVIEIIPASSSLFHRFTVRAGKLYNLDTNSFTWTGPVKVNLVRFLDIEDLPPAARGYIVAYAARKFSQDYLGNRTFTEQLREDEYRARNVLVNHESSTGLLSSLAGWAAGRVVWRRGSALVESL